MKIQAPLTAALIALSAVNAEGNVPICLHQNDFDFGTKIITTPGSYKLCENIVFSPNAPNAGELPDEDAFDPIFDGSYDKNAFGLGFFSAIAIATSDVKFSLNGFTIEQSEGHALFQRFFAIIELADSPFIKSAGPAQFVGDGSTFNPASNIEIFGPGTIGRSSHHGIHGNENSNIIIKDVTFTDFEVAAVSLNNVDTLEIKDCRIIQNRQDVPVLGFFSAAQFIRPYGKKLKELGYEMTLRGESVSAATLYDNLISSISHVYDDVINSSDGEINATEHPEEHKLFHNRFRTVDGPCYAFVVHGKGPAVGGQGDIFSEDTTKTSSQVSIKGNTIKNIKCWTNEVPAVVEEGKVVNDARGAVFQLISSVDNTPIARNTDGTYKGNVVADMQIMVAKAIQDDVLTGSPELQVEVNSINSALIDWAMSGTSVYTPNYRCNGDSMHHVGKGIIVVRVEDTQGFDIQNNIIDSITSLTPPPYAECDSFHLGASEENTDEQQGGNIRAISVAAVRGYVKKLSTIKGNIISDANSENANVIIGIDIQGDSKSTEIKNNMVDLGDGAKKIGLRVREFTDSDGSDAIVVGPNIFVQSSEILNRRKLRNKRVLHPHVDDLEWKLGGCPFARSL